MKRIGKLTINTEKVIRNEDLMNLRGGYTEDEYGGGCTPGAVGTEYWKCCVNGTPHTYYKSSASDAEKVCELYHGEDNCDC